MRLNKIYTHEIPAFQIKNFFTPQNLYPPYGIYNYTARLLSVYIIILTLMPLSSLRFVWEFELAAQSYSIHSIFELPLYRNGWARIIKLSYKLTANYIEHPRIISQLRYNYNYDAYCWWMASECINKLYCVYTYSETFLSMVHIASCCLDVVVHSYDSDKGWEGCFRVRKFDGTSPNLSPSWPL